VEQGAAIAWPCVPRPRGTPEKHALIWYGTVLRLR